MSDLILPNDGPRVEPLAPGQVNSGVLAEYEKTVRTWGIPNNLIRTMAAMPQLALTEVDYANAFIFDTDTYTDWPKPGSASESVKFPTADFVDRVTKELVINLVSLLNRSRYSITHHSFIGFMTIKGATEDEGKARDMLLHLANGSGEPTYKDAPSGLYSEYQLAALDLAEKIQSTTGHSVSDEQVKSLRDLMRGEARKKSSDNKLPEDDEYIEALVDGMYVELTWCICHFGGLLNKWFTILKVKDEEYPVAGGNSFVANYNALVPEEVRIRNNQILGADGWGSEG